VEEFIFRFGNTRMAWTTPNQMEMCKRIK